MWKAVMSLLIALAAAVACKVTMKTGEEVPLFGGTEFEGEFDPGTGKGSIPEQPGLERGACVQITFYDADGNEIGKTEALVGGGKYDVPPGTSEASVSECDEKDAKDKAKKSSGVSALRVAAEPVRIPMRIVPFSTRGHVGSFEAIGVSEKKAREVAASFMGTMTSAPPPFGINVGPISSFESDDTGVLITMHTLSAPSAIQFDWNGTPLFYNLNSAVVWQEGGWYHTAVHVPASLVDYHPTGTSVNEYAWTLQTATGPFGATVAVTVDA
jgi:hypothetical protein